MTKYFHTWKLRIDTLAQEGTALPPFQFSPDSLGRRQVFKAVCSLETNEVKRKLLHLNLIIPRQFKYLRLLICRKAMFLFSRSIVSYFIQFGSEKVFTAVLILKKGNVFLMFLTCWWRRIRYSVWMSKFGGNNEDWQHNLWQKEMMLIKCVLHSM